MTSQTTREGGAPAEDRPEVTLGLPIYNGASYLEKTLSALLAQDYPRFTILVSDNCSTDSSREICEGFASKDARIVYTCNETNLGAAANFNRVVELARTPYFAWANHDDLWEVDYVSRCVSALQSFPDAVLAYSRSAKIDSSGEVVAPLMADLQLDEASPQKRLRRYHDHFRDIDRRKAWSAHEIEGLWIPVYGVMRREQLAETGIIGPYISSDTILLEELLMRGRFLEIEQTMFFKRDHEDRSMRASVSYEKRLDWFTGKKAGLLIFPRWRLLRERLAAVLRTPMPGSERLACLAEMLTFYVRRPHEGKVLVKELGVNAVRLTRPVLKVFGRQSMTAPEKW